MSPAREAKPLADVRILVGRARPQAGKLSAGLKKLGAEIIEIPFIEMRTPKSYKPLDGALKNLASYDWLILTSTNGVDALAERLRKLKLKSSSLRHLNIAAIGPATKGRIEELGLKVAVVPNQYVAESVVKSLHSRVEGKRVLLARAKVARDVIPRELRKAGAKVDVVEAYETMAPAASERRLQSLMANPKRTPDVICFTSSSTVKNFVELLRGQECPRHTKLASIGPVTSGTLRELGLRVHIQAREYTIPGLIRAIEEQYAKRKVRGE